MDTYTFIVAIASLAYLTSDSKLKIIDQILKSIAKIMGRK